MQMGAFELIKVNQLECMLLYMYVSHSQVGKQDDVPTKSININENRCI
jgi:hypothetical protein